MATPTSRIRTSGSAARAGIGIFALVLIAGAQTADRTIAAWFPLQPGNTWVYRNETLDGDMTHPDVERWTTEETIVSAVANAELAGTLITERIKVLDDFLSPGWNPGFPPGNDRAKSEPPERHLLIRRNCVYVLHSPQDRDDLRRGNLAPDYCFPLSKGTTWGRVPSTSPANEYVWTVAGINADPFGSSDGKTFHLSSWEGGALSLDRWFEQGVGLLQENHTHHGTYDETRVQLLSATINGKTQTLHLTPARTVPLGDQDCAGPGWKHFSRADGTPFASLAACISYASRRR